MTKDRLTRHIEDLKSTIQTLQETDSRVARYVALQESLTRAEAVNEEIREAEERVAVVSEPRRPRARKNDMTDTNGTVHVYRDDQKDPIETPVVEPE